MKKTKYIVMALIVIVIVGLAYKSCVLAQEKRAAIENKIIGSTFKTLVKAYVATADINKIKEKGIKKINKMDKEKFRIRYAKVYDAVKNLPENLKVEYGVTEDKTREQAVKDIESLDKTKIYKAIDAIPDAIIVDNFKQCLNEKREGIQHTNLVEQINRVWAKVMLKVDK